MQKASEQSQDIHRAYSLGKNSALQQPLWHGEQPCCDGGDWQWQRHGRQYTWQHCKECAYPLSLPAALLYTIAAKLHTHVSSIARSGMRMALPVWQTLCLTAYALVIRCRGAFVAGCFTLLEIAVVVPPELVFSATQHGAGVSLTDII
jgi:hypothetical protein